MSGRQPGAKDGEAASRVAGESRTTSHLRFKSPSRRDEGATDSASWMGGFTPSTLPPAPFEHEADVSGHEWWLDAHMNAAANILCLEQLVDVVMDSADVLALERVRALIARLGDVRDALYELYCDAADPRMRGSSTPDGPPFFDNPFFRRGLPPERLAQLTTTARDQQANDASRPLWLRMFDTDKKNLKKLSDAGVRVGFGTDSGGAPERWFIQGWFEHRQMELMRDAGLTPMQIIQAFSKNNSEMLGISADFGTLAPGKAADLLVLAKNPLDDIANMRSIEEVWLGGKKFE